MAATRWSIRAGELVKERETGAAAIAASFLAEKVAQLLSVTVKFSAAPTTSESLTVTLNAQAGAAYDAELYSVNPSIGSDTVIVWQPSQPLFIAPGDAIDVAFLNTDTRTYGVEITLKEEL